MRVKLNVTISAFLSLYATVVLAPPPDFHTPPGAQIYLNPGQAVILNGTGPLTYVNPSSNVVWHFKPSEMGGQFGPTATAFGRATPDTWGVLSWHGPAGAGSRTEVLGAIRSTGALQGCSTIIDLGCNGNMSVTGNGKWLSQQLPDTTVIGTAKGQYTFARVKDLNGEAVLSYRTQDIYGNRVPLNEQMQVFRNGEYINKIPHPERIFPSNVVFEQPNGTYIRGTRNIPNVPLDDLLSGSGGKGPYSAGGTGAPLGAFASNVVVGGTGLVGGWAAQTYIGDPLFGQGTVGSDLTGIAGGVGGTSVGVFGVSAYGGATWTAASLEGLAAAGPAGAMALTFYGGLKLGNKIEEHWSPLVAVNRSAEALERQLFTPLPMTGDRVKDATIALSNLETGTVAAAINPKAARVYGNISGAAADRIERNATKVLENPVDRARAPSPELLLKLRIAEAETAAGISGAKKRLDELKKLLNRNADIDCP